MKRHEQQEDIKRQRCVHTNKDFFLEKCQRVGGHFQSKNLYCRFWKLNTGLFEHEIDKKKSNFRVQGMCFQQLYWYELILIDIE